MLDISTYNSYVLWISVNTNWNKNSLIKIRFYLQELGKSLITQNIKSNKYTPRTFNLLNIVKVMQGQNKILPLESSDGENAHGASFCTKK